MAKFEKLIGAVGKEKIILLILAGIVLVLASIPWQNNDRRTTEQTQNSNRAGNEMTLDEYQEKLEKKLAGLVSSIDGAGEVKVMITFSASSEKIVKENHQLNKEQNGTSGNTNQKLDSNKEAVIAKDSDGNEYPYIVKEMQPLVEGVAIVAQGAGNATVKAQIYETAKALLGIEMNKIAVTKMKPGNES